ncbi:hypothetical protein MBM_04012 [Drepanopeziza brunnea f. sp. 'multigermtubi' MB_m1]|uniref:Uncharacterized protein n=1 Tax=Marssonina brunnea f. sp. multigermtubi (strain MB_m1) TaxID=1072389 RepID=K1XAF6_MARBU|nr:uncharacterized protein MBM_04012 [Drepanopeziza brunnea f. sp. 'multigermtubi' MB_m1]EKD17643.1 hypothetical protein MBM_04012 [Drepanopeziza brunnea f. sp. 'multigermtubi' MB_m1]
MHSPTLVAALVVLLGFVTASPMVSPKVSSKLEPRQDMQFCILKGALTCGRAFNPRVGVRAPCIFTRTSIDIEADNSKRSISAAMTTSSTSMESVPQALIASRSAVAMVFSVLRTEGSIRGQL